MKSIHLQQLFEQLATDLNLSDNHLFFNLDGSVNKKELYKQLQYLGVTKELLATAIDARETDTLENAHDITLTNIEHTTIGDLFLNWINPLIVSNTICLPTTAWNPAVLPPLNTFSYYDGVTSSWIDVGQDVYIEDSTAIADNSPWGVNKLRASSASVTGMTCTYGKIDVSVVAEVDVGGSMLTRNVILTLDASGNLEQHIIQPTLPMPPIDTICDIARVGANLYSLNYANTKLYRVVGPWEGGNDGLTSMEEMPGFDTTDYFDASHAAIQFASMNAVGSSLYIFIHNGPERRVLIRYDLLTQTSELVASSEDYVFHFDGYITVEPTGIVYTPQGHALYVSAYRPYSLLLSDISNTDESIRATSFDKHIYFNHATQAYGQGPRALAYDPVHTCVYIVTNGMLHRWR